MKGRAMKGRAKQIGTPTSARGESGCVVEGCSKVNNQVIPAP